MFTTLGRSLALGATAAILTATLAACSGDEDSSTAAEPPGQTSSEAPSAESSDAPKGVGFSPEDVAEPGEDLLERWRVGGQFTKGVLEATWKFPATYERPSGVTTKAYTQDDHFRISVQSGPGDQAKAAAALASAQRQAEARGQATTLDTVTVAGREFAVLVQDTPEAGIITYSHAPAEGQEFYIVQLAAGLPLAEVPQEKFEEFLQTVGSLQFQKR